MTEMSAAWTHCTPVAVHAGRGSLDRLPELAGPGAWLLVTSRGAVARGTAERVARLLRQGGRTVTVCDAIGSNPRLADLEALRTHHRDARFQGLVALGGGSVLDAAKVLSAMLVSPLAHPLEAQLRHGRALRWDTGLPVVAIPTTAGSGAEVTPFATVWEPERHRKHSVSGTGILPRIALLDPCLTLTLPRRQTLFSGLDAISHALESTWNRNRTPVSEALAWHALELAVPALPRVLEQPGELEARERLQQASLLAGLAISQTRTAIAHSISYPLTSHHGVPHGLACSFTLPCLVEDNLERCPAARRPVLEATLALLRSLHLDREIRAFLGNADLRNLYGEMITPGRADNYTGRIDLDDLLRRAVGERAARAPFRPPR